MIIFRGISAMKCLNNELNTYRVSLVESNDKVLEEVVLTIPKNELDHKDKKHKKIPEQFTVELVWTVHSSPACRPGMF